MTSAKASNKALQRRPRSESLINFGAPFAAPLNAGVRRFAEQRVENAMSEETEAIVSYRPVGQKELDLIAASNDKAGPPRLPEQPIFYPVLNEAYATQIAEKWNAKPNDPPVG